MKNSILLFLFFISIFASSCKKEKCNMVEFCPSKNDYFFYRGKNDSAWISVPNAISPNGDGINDKLYINGYNRTFNCNIYDGNRLVFHMDHYPEYWDGLDNGVYKEKVYTVKVVGYAMDTTYSITGTISVLPKVMQGIQDATFDGNAIWHKENAQFGWQSVLFGGFDSNLPNYENIVTTSYNSCK